MAFAAAEGDNVRANHKVEKAEQAEHDAADRFHEAERQEFKE